MWQRSGIIWHITPGACVTSEKYTASHLVLVCSAQQNMFAKRSQLLESRNLTATSYVNIIVIQVNQVGTIFNIVNCQFKIALKNGFFVQRRWS